MKHYDVAVIGAGIAGASIAAEIGGDRSTIILEAEDQPGYHATGRSAAFWTETYGGPQVQPLTTASYAFLNAPPPEFSEQSFLNRRGALNICRREETDLLETFLAEFSDSGVAMERWTTDKINPLVPDIRAEWDQAVYEPDCCDIDVAGLHMAYLRHARKLGVILQCRTPVESIRRHDGYWSIQSGSAEIRARQIVNAAGAWADEIAAQAGVEALGIQPMRRTMVQLRTRPPSDIAQPLVVALDGSFYFKPEAGGGYWLSPHDETPTTAGDVAPEEWDIALAIDRFQAVLDVQIEAVTRKWAGLRSFTPDRLPAYGFDPRVADFFWFAGQGGFGIQTAPAAAKLARSILLDQECDATLGAIDASLYDPVRFTR